MGAKNLFSKISLNCILISFIFPISYFCYSSLSFLSYDLLRFLILCLYLRTQGRFQRLRSRHDSFTMLKSQHQDTLPVCLPASLPSDYKYIYKKKVSIIFITPLLCPLLCLLFICLALTSFLFNPNQRARLQLSYTSEHF